jgi:putative phosphoribosyl transferase
MPIPLNAYAKNPNPWNPEAGYGAVAPDGSVVLNEALVQQLGLSGDDIKQHASLVLEEIQRRTQKFLGDRPFPDLDSRLVILTDDGLASGFTMLAALRAVKEKHPSKVIVAVPTAPLSTINRILPEIDELICLNVRDSRIFAVADAYRKWYDLTDQEVAEYLKRLNILEK